MFTSALGVTPFDKNHTSKNTLDLTKDLLQFLRLINTGYIGESYTDYWLFRVAEFLDSRTHKTVPFAD